MYNDDPVKHFAFSTLKQIPFLQELEREREWDLLHKIYYTMKKRVIRNGDYLCVPG